MYVCIYVCVYVYMHARVYVCVYVCLYLYVCWYVCMHVWVCVFVCVRLRIVFVACVRCVCLCVCVLYVLYLCACLCACVREPCVMASGMTVFYFNNGGADWPARMLPHRHEKAEPLCPRQSFRRPRCPGSQVQVREVDSVGAVTTASLQVTT